MNLYVLLCAALLASHALCVEPAPPTSLRPLPASVDANLLRIFFVGDTHGDSYCAKEWIQRTGLVDFSQQPWKWTGAETDAIVFLGDYVDKGITSRSNLELMRTMHATFPDHVVAIVGNHDLFILVDTVLHPSAPRPMGVAVSQYAYSFQHPQEYLEAGWSPKRPDDAELMAAYLQALQLVYAHNYESRMKVPSILQEAPPFKGNETLQQRMQQRLSAWEREYAQGMVDSGLAAWLAQLPIVAAVGDALVVHGGVPQKGLAAAIQSANRAHRKGPAAYTRGPSAHESLHREVNDPFFAWGRENVMLPGESAMTNTRGFRIGLVEEAVQYRGYFSACREVAGVLDLLRDDEAKEEEQEIRRIVVGHTPDDNVRLLCDGTLLASDSALSRHFRAYGNRYCPVGSSEAAELTRALTQSIAPQSGCSRAYVEQCEGNVAYLERASASDAWPMQAKLVPWAGLAPIAQPAQHDEI